MTDEQLIRHALDALPPEACKEMVGAAVEALERIIGRAEEAENALNRERMYSHWGHV